ncbi:MAG: glycoside hydrolase family 65 protein [Chitinispirillaceae bacterium]|nr:glycoside hydrolase family 65 protein [Chitinispirillaceae bacterium]
MKDWTLVYEGYDPKQEPLREALCTLGNGYFATRGAAEESPADDVHYPGTYLAGGYNRLPSRVADRTIINEDLVNFPNWLVLKFRAGDGEGHWFDLEKAQLLAYRQELDMRSGLLMRTFRYRDRLGRETSVASRRLVHMEYPHLAALEVRITPENWSGLLTVHSALDGSVINAGVARYRQLNSKHLEVIERSPVNDESMFLRVRTVQSRIEMAQAARTRIYKGDKPVSVHCRTLVDDELVARELAVEAGQGQSITIEKVLALYTSRDQAISECGMEARDAVAQVGRFDEMLASQRLAWAHLWRRCDLEIQPAGEEQMILRLHIFHLLQTVCANSIGLDVGVPARGWHGEAYRGHIFWDELFIFPFYNLRIPEITRALLLYRFRRLNAARRLAREAGFRGAMYPWQSGSNGQEETQSVHLNPKSGKWDPDHSRNQRHVNVAIAYNVWEYYLVSGDREFIFKYGAEMVLEIARFFYSMTTFNAQTGRYEIRGVMGPDEYHEKYPDSDEAGLRNNTYTNVMVVWLLDRALDILDLLPPERRREIKERISLSDEEIDTWRKVDCRMTVPYHGEDVISQFEGYDKLDELDWEGLRKKYGSIARLDRILKAEGDSPDHYQVSKQADVLMLFYLMTRKGLRRIFKRLGYPFDDDVIRRTIEYYRARTTHGSTLSKVVHAAVLDRFDRSAGWELFRDALRADVADVQGGTTPEGIHLGAMAGTVVAMLRHYAGVDTTRWVIAFYPRLPEAMDSLKLNLRHHGRWFELDIRKDRFELRVDERGPEPVPVTVFGTPHLIPSGGTFACDLPQQQADAAGADRIDDTQYDLSAVPP